MCALFNYGYELFVSCTRWAKKRLTVTVNILTKCRQQLLNSTTLPAFSGSDHRQYIHSGPHHWSHTYPSMVSQHRGVRANILTAMHVDRFHSSLSWVEWQYRPMHACHKQWAYLMLKMDMTRQIVPWNVVSRLVYRASKSSPHQQLCGGHGPPVQGCGPRPHRSI